MREIEEKSLEGESATLTADKKVGRGKVKGARWEVRGEESRRQRLEVRGQSATLTADKKMRGRRAEDQRIRR